MRLSNSIIISFFFLLELLRNYELIPTFLFTRLFQVWLHICVLLLHSNIRGYLSKRYCCYWKEIIDWRVNFCVAFLISKQEGNICGRKFTVSYLQLEINKQYSSKGAKLALTCIYLARSNWLRKHETNRWDRR